jgi:hypothetical protein
MMDWHQHFGKQFFTNWQQAGLPHHEPFLPEYFQRLGQIPKQAEWVHMATTLETGIDPAKLFGVYNFGATVGKLLVDVLDIDAEVSTHTADWCGKFNLGISLFDYIADEQQDGQTLTAMEVFQPFAASTSATKPLTPTMELLNSLASGILHDIKQQAPPLLEMMQRMFDAEQVISNTTLRANVDLRKIEKALFLKSAGPFEMMAAYTANVADAQNKPLLEMAAQLGTALGCGYWLIDDAKDLQTDFEEGHWNIFLHEIAVKYPAFFAQPLSEISYNAVLQIVEKEQLAQKLSRQTIRQIQQATAALPIANDRLQQSLGLLAASMWQWYYY